MSYQGGVSKNELESRLRSLETRIRQLLAQSTDQTVRSVAVQVAAIALDNVGWADVGGKPSTFPPGAHTHSESEITDLDRYTQAEIDLIVENILLTGLADVDMGGAETGHVLAWNDELGIFTATPSSGRPGITYRTIPEDVTVEVRDGEQYLVFQELTIEGELNLDGGELVVL